MPLQDFAQCFCSSSAEFLARSRPLLIKYIYIYISTNSIIILLRRAVSIFSSSANYTAYITKPPFNHVDKVLNKVENLTKMQQLLLGLRLELRMRGGYGQKPERRELNQNPHCNPESLGTSALQSTTVSASPPHIGRQMGSHTHMFFLRSNLLYNDLWVILKYILILYQDHSS